MEQVLSLLFPTQKAFPFVSDDQTVLVVGQHSKVKEPYGYEPMMAKVDMEYRTLNFSFLASRAGYVFDCIVQTDFTDQVAAAWGQHGKGSKYEFPMNIDAQIEHMGVYVAGTKSEDGFPKQMDQIQVLSTEIKGNQATPYNAIKMIKDAIDSFNKPFDDDGDEDEPDFDPSPSPSKSLSGPLVAV